MSNPNGNPKNLKPNYEGRNINPMGRKGKDGTKGLSLKGSYKKFLENMPIEEHDKVWLGLLRKCRDGDTAAIKLMIELNGEQVNDKLLDVVESSAKIVINIPHIEEE